MEKFNSHSPHCQRPIFLCVAKENECNIRQSMTDLINPDTERMTTNGITIADNQHIRIDIVRSMW